MTGITLRFAGYQPPASVHSRAAAVFGQALSDRLGDGVDFHLDGNIIDHGRNAADLLDMVESGEIDLCYFSASYLAERVPEFALLDLPFVITGRAAAYGILDGAVGALLADRLAAETGMRALAFWDNGFRHISNRARPIRTPADCTGMTIRTLSSDLHTQTFRRLGFDPITLDVKALIEAVRGGTIDAQDNALTNIHNFRIHKFHRHITLTGHFFGAAVLLCNGKALDGWSGEFRDALTEAAAEATAAQRGFAAAEDAHVLSQLNPDENDVLELTDTERKSFQEAVAPILNAQRSRFGNTLFDLIVDSDP